jgi:hypothetical protein
VDYSDKAPKPRRLPAEIVNDKGHYRQHKIEVSLGNPNLFGIASHHLPQKLVRSDSKAFAFRSRGRQGLFASLRSANAAAAPTFDRRFAPGDGLIGQKGEMRHFW